MPNIYKIGMTERDPNERLLEANASYTWKPPMNFELEFTVKVVNYKKKEKMLHKILEAHGKRINPRQEFFSLPLEIIKMYFELLNDSDVIDLPVEDYKPPEANNELNCYINELNEFINAYIDTYDGSKSYIRTRAYELYSAYVDWCNSTNLDVIMTLTKFGREIKNLPNISKSSQRDGIYYTISLVDN
jgi:hypothetical protein